jgi:hypothetical protein
MENRSRTKVRTASQFHYETGERQDIKVKIGLRQGFPKYHGGNTVA